MTTTLEEVQAEAERLEAELEEVRERARQLAQGITKPVTLDDLPTLQRYFRRKRVMFTEADIYNLRPTGNENVALMREVVRRIKAEHARDHRRFNMHTWFKGPKALRAGEEPPCGTQACLAGWTSIVALKSREVILAPSALDTPQVRYGNGRTTSVGDYSARQLGLTEEQTHFLFEQTPGARLKTIIEACSYVFGEDFR